MGYALKAGSVVFARAIYALNWLDIAPGLVLISESLNLKLIDLGIVTTSFFLGLTVFQLLGGGLASRIGSRKVAFIGLILLGIGGIASGFSFNLDSLIISRFTAGIGSAFFFSPGLILLKEVSPPESYGFQVGMYEAAFSLGGGIGAFGWVFVNQLVGWRIGLVIGGVLSVGIALENYIILMDIGDERNLGAEFGKRILEILKSKILWLLPIATISGIVTENIVGQFIVYYGEKYLLLSITESGLVDGLYFAFGVFGGVVGGYFLKNTRIRLRFSYLVFILTGVLFIAIPFLKNFIALSIDVAVLGFISISIFSILYLLAVENSRDKSMASFSLSFVNFIQMAIGSVSPVVFTFLTYRLGYEYGWIILGVVGLLVVPLITLSLKQAY
ncbi:MAG: MFS transporter [Candidatus Thermoplasmatota archaeon]|jgi:MFS family permease|nr:MFS transporter [Candidatus Thermoplasmatota archaeon]